MGVQMQKLYPQLEQASSNLLPLLKGFVAEIISPEIVTNRFTLLDRRSLILIGFQSDQICTCHSPISFLYSCKEWVTLGNIFACFFKEFDCLDRIKQQFFVEFLARGFEISQADQDGPLGRVEFGEQLIVVEPVIFLLEILNEEGKLFFDVIFLLESLVLNALVRVVNLLSFYSMHNAPNQLIQKYRKYKLIPIHLYIINSFKIQQLMDPQQTQIHTNQDNDLNNHQAKKTNPQQKQNSNLIVEDNYLLQETNLLKKGDHKALFKKFQKKHWNAIENEISFFAQKVNRIMISLGEGIYDDIVFYNSKSQIDVEKCYEDQKILGQDLYLQVVRPKLIKCKLLPKQQTIKADKKKDKKKKNTKHITKMQQVRLKNTKENVNKDLMNMIKLFEDVQNLKYQFGLKQKIVQLKIVTFLYIAKFYTFNKDRKDFDLADVFELINIMLKVTRSLEGYKWKSVNDSQQEVQISLSCIRDVRNCCNILAQYYNYNVQNILTNYPKLIYHTVYDSYFHTLDMKPYPTQQKLYRYVYEYLDQWKNMLVKQDSKKNKRAALILYRAMIGSGKTSMAIALASFIQTFREKKNIKVLYCCVIDSVRMQVGKLAYNSTFVKKINSQQKQKYDGIKFALASMDTLKTQQMMKNKHKQWQREYKDIWDKYIQDEEEKNKKGMPWIFRMIRHFRVKKQQQPSLVIGDLFSTCEMLKKQRENCILFIDEPTAYCMDNPPTKKLIQILKYYAPRITILCSATLPLQNQIPNLIKQIRNNRKEQLDIINITSDEFHVGCQFCSFYGDVLYPHMGVKSAKELKRTIELIKNNPFLLRLYTGASLFLLLSKCQKEDIKGLPEVSKDIEINQSKIIKYSFEILQLLTKESDEKVQRICKPSKQLMNISSILKQKGQYKDKIDSDEQIIFQGKKKEQEKDQADSEKYVRFSKLAKTDSYKFTGGCLIAVESPIEFARECFNYWVKNITSLKKLFAQYDKEKNILNEKIQKIQGSQEFHGQIEKIKQKYKLIQQSSVMIKFPDHKRINTKFHYQRYGKQVKVTNGLFIKAIQIEKVGLQLLEQKQQWIVKLLMCGVGIYTQKQLTGVSRLYYQKVIQLASQVILSYQGYLAYLITDQSLCFGSNFPLSNVILLDDLADKLKMNEIFQLIGRAGRVGQSWIARAFLQPNTISRLQKYIRGQDERKSIQGQTIQNLLEQLKKQDFQQLDLKIMGQAKRIYRYY